jgi:hypothetical protein
MTGDERSRMAKLIKRWEQDRVASATVILAQGMLGAMQRSVLTGLQLVARPPHPQKVFSEIAPAVQWLTPYIHEAGGPKVSHTALLASVEALCVSFQARAR